MKRIAIILLSLLVGASAFAEDFNVTPSPDGTMEAFTRDNDLWVRDLATGGERRLTDDGSELILNGFASWVYYEEILGRPSKYRAFWWSPDSRRIGFFRSDNTQVPMFPIYSPFGQDGSIISTRYPKAGEPNPEVRVGMVEVASGEIVWAGFERSSEQYFCRPFWGPDSREFFVVRQPRRQDRLGLFAVSATDGSLRLVYHEEYPSAWVNQMEQILFCESGMYVARDFTSGWQQIYFIPYYGGEARCLTSGPNWNVSLLKADEKKGEVWFSANRDSDVRRTLYRLDKKGRITAMTDPAMTVESVEFDADGRGFTATLSNYSTPRQVWRWDSKKMTLVEKNGDVADFEGMSVPQDMRIEIEGQMVPAKVYFPVDFDPEKKYPVHIEIYGGPGTQYVRDVWRNPGEEQWFAQNGIIHMVADCRASGHGGRAGTDLIFEDLTTVPVQDFCRWAEYLGTLPYVDASRIGVEGFSFGGTMTTILLLDRSDLFCCGIAGGGVADWKLYDTNYTERFMNHPASNPEGYEKSSAMYYVDPAHCKAPYNGHLMITHGTGDDNVHFQNTLQLIDAMQRQGLDFELMIYPDGKHGYRGEQHSHDLKTARAFWTKYLLNNQH